MTKLLFLYLAVVLCSSILYFCDAVPPWFSTGLPHRAQTDSLLRGKLSLSDNPADLSLVQYDLCWSEGGVQQVWGLGVPIWRLPFEILARVFGQDAFPDRVALGLFMALGIYISLSTWFYSASFIVENGDSGPVNQGITVQCLIGIGAIILSTVFAPVINLIRSPLGHYEEVAVYGFFYAVALASGLVALDRNPRKSLFLVLCLFAGLGGLIRPTLVSYGAATVLVASLMLMFRGTPSLLSKFARWRTLFLGFCLFGLGGSVLFVTNLIRFGSGLEFGHRLNLSPALTLLYMERIENAFAQIPLNQAARELFGFLFLTKKFNGTAWYDSGLFPGQSSVIRWRMIDLTTYDLSYVFVLAIAWGLGIYQVWHWARRRRRSREPQLIDSYVLHPSAFLIAWSLITVAALAMFYLKLPMIASRYMIDFSPAFAVSFIALWWWGIETIAKRVAMWKLVCYSLCVTLVAWQGWEMSKGKSGFGRPRSISQEQITALMQPKVFSGKELVGEYHVGDSMDSWGIPHNGEGWDAKDGHIWSLATFFVKDPQFIELTLSETSTNHSENVSITDIRAKIGLEFLKRDSIMRTDSGWTVRFMGSQQRRYQHGLQTLFLATVPTSELANYVVPASPWILRRVRWCDAKAP